MERRDTTADAPDREDMFEVLVTAQEAWPAFERAVLGAETVVRASFRIFDFAAANCRHHDQIRLVRCTKKHDQKISNTNLFGNLKHVV